MNNGKDYNYDKGAWVMKHPPPNHWLSYQILNCRRKKAHTFYHPPPKVLWLNQPL